MIIGLEFIALTTNIALVRYGTVLCYVMLWSRGWREY